MSISLARATTAFMRADNEDWRSQLIVNSKDAPKPLLANAIIALRQSREWKNVLHFDEFSLHTVAIGRLPWRKSDSKANWSDHDDRLCTDWLQHQGIYVSVEITAHAVQSVAHDQTIHPVKEYLEGLKWDGNNRIDQWLTDYLGVAPTSYVSAVGSRWLISAVARIYQPGVKADCVLLLEGEQGTKKSTALKTLGGEWFTDEIADLGSKDSALQTRGVWLIEIAELDSMSKGEVGKIKAFISRGTDRFRPPFGRRVIESPRQCVFAGSVNQQTYLRDETGARRFWPVRTGSIDIRRLSADRDQLWAEANLRYKEGSTWWLDSLALTSDAASEQAQRFDGDVWEPIISAWIADRDSTSIEEVLGLCFDKPKGMFTQTDQNRVSRSLKHLGWEKYRERAADGLRWKYRRSNG